MESEMNSLINMFERHSLSESSASILSRYLYNQNSLNDYNSTISLIDNLLWNNLSDEQKITLNQVNAPEFLPDYHTFILKKQAAQFENTILDNTNNIKEESDKYRIIVSYNKIKHLEPYFTIIKKEVYNCLYPFYIPK